MANAAYHARLLSLSTLEELQGEMRRLGVDRGGIPIMAAKGVLRLVKVEQIPTPAANIIKQEILARGGDLATPWSASAFAAPAVDVIFIGSLTTLRSTLSKLYRQRVYDLPAIADAVQQVLIRTTPGYLPVARQPNRQGTVVEETLDDLAGGRLPLDPVTSRATAQPVCLTVGDQPWRFGEITYVVASLPVDAILASADATIAVEAEVAGAHLLTVEADHDAGEVTAAIRLVRAHCPGLPVAVRTDRPAVAAAALEAGARILQPAGPSWEALVPAAASAQAILVLPHSLTADAHSDPLAAMSAWFYRAMDRAVSLGLGPEQMILNPGLDQGNCPADVYAVLRRLRELTGLGRPIWVAPCTAAALQAAAEQPEWSAAGGAALAIAIANGADFVEIRPRPDLIAAVRTADLLTRHTGQH